MKQANIPDVLYNQVQAMATQQGITADELINIALAQTIGAWSEHQAIQLRAKRASRSKYHAVLDQVPDVEPEEYDKLPE